MASTTAGLPTITSLVTAGRRTTIDLPTPRQTNLDESECVSADCAGVKPGEEKASTIVPRRTAHRRTRIASVTAARPDEALLFVVILIFNYPISSCWCRTSRPSG